MVSGAVGSRLKRNPVSKQVRTAATAPPPGVPLSALFFVGGGEEGGSTMVCATALIDYYVVVAWWTTRLFSKRFMRRVLRRICAIVLDYIMDVILGALGSTASYFVVLYTVLLFVMHPAPSRIEEGFVLLSCATVRVGYQYLLHCTILLYYCTAL